MTAFVCRSMLSTEGGIGMTAKRTVSKSRAEEPRAPRLTLRVSGEEFALLEEAAGPYPVATWARVALLDAARAAVAGRTTKGGKR